MCALLRNMILKIVVILYFISVVCLAKFLGGNGSKSLKRGLIIGGENATIKSVPYMADVDNCGGAIIGKRWVLTAGHCEKPSFVKLGSSHFGKGEKHRVGRAITHPKFYYRENVTPMYDFQLLELSEEITFSDSVRSIELGDDDDIMAGELATVSGWGLISEGWRSTVLKIVNVTIVNDDICRNLYKDYFTDATFCAGDKGKDACNGDSGGPITSKGTLIGVVSFGYKCGSPTYPGVYSRIPYAREWIRNITGI